MAAITTPVVDDNSVMVRAATKVAAENGPERQRAAVSPIE
jgi:hypothetical protein